MNFSRTDCVLSNLTSFISCRTSLTAIKDDIEIVEKKLKVSELEEFFKGLK